MNTTVKYAQKTLSNLQLGLATGLVVLTQIAMAADEIGITPYQRQLNLKNDGIVTLKFELENHSGAAQQLQELITLPAGWQLINNTAPFLLANGARDVRLIHVSPPKNAAAGHYVIAYQVTALDNGGITSNQIININLQTQAGLNIETQQAPITLLAKEAFSVDFLLANTGNTQVSYKLDAYDTEGFIQATHPKQVTLNAGDSTLVQVKGRVKSKITETTQYSLTLQARGGGRKAEQTAAITLIAPTPAGIGKYQKLPGQLKASYSIQPGTDSHEKSDWLAQLEYFGRGSIDSQGKHHVEIKLRNGQKQNKHQQTNQLEEYYFTYWNDELKIKTGHQAFTTNQLSGNSLTGIGATVTYTPKNKHGKTPLKIQAFHGQTRLNNALAEKSIYAALSYTWDQYELSTSILEYEKKQEKQQQIHTIGGVWHGKNTTVRTEIASDGKNKAYTGEVSAQWNQIGANASITRADKNFSGSISDALQAYGNLSYQLDGRNTFSTKLRHTRDNIDSNQNYEIREVQEGQLRFTHSLATENSAEVTLGYRHSQERDLRSNASTHRTTQAVMLEYRQQFENVDLRLGAELGRRHDKLKTSTVTGSSQEASINWHPQHNINLGINASINQELDYTGKTYSSGLNAQYSFSPRSQISGYAQRSQKEEDKSYIDSYNLEYKYDLRKTGQITLSAYQNKNINSKVSDNIQDRVLKLEYSLPLDIPFRKRENIGSLEGKLYRADGQTANNVILQMDNSYAVTNQQGEFSYPNIVAKDYQLSINSSHSSSSGLILDMINDNNLIQVQANKTTRAEFVVQQGTQLKGRLLRFIPNTVSAVIDDAETNTLKADKGIGMVLIELHPIGEPSNRIVHRRSTLYDGSFSFLGIPPGQWELIVADSKRIPEHFNLEQSRFMVELKPGNNQDILIRALPTSKAIKKIGPNQGFDVSG